MFPLEKLHAMLKQADAADAARKQFGAAKHQYRWNPPVNPQELEEFEQEIESSLPEDYRNFLLRAGDGGAGPFYGLFSLKQVRSWLEWEVEPKEAPFLRPGVNAEQLDDVENWRRGCILIGDQGDTYFTGLMIAGPNRGRVVYIDYEGSWVFFPDEPDFLAWYSRWLREVAAGYRIFWFGTYLDGDETALRARYKQADSAEERLRVLGSMRKFPALSEDSRDFLRSIFADWVNAENTGNFSDLLCQVSAEVYEQFLDRRWENGWYDQVLYELYHTPADQKAIAARWRSRILEKLPEIPSKSYCITIPLLRRGGGVTLAQTAFLLDKAQGQEKRNLLIDLGRLPDAGEHPEIWLRLLEEREDLELLHYALLSVPKVSDPRLREAAIRVKEAFPFAMEQIVHVDYQDKEAFARSVRRNQERKVYQGACHVLTELFYETINPETENLPRPYRLELSGHTMGDLGMYQTPPADGIPVHPLVALAILQESGGRLPATAWDWEKKIQKIKRLQLQLTENTVSGWDDENRRAVLHGPGEHSLPAPYYFDLQDWSVIGRMTNLRELRISQICVEDFSFLRQCKHLRTLALYNTNFTDCRLLLELPELKRADLRLCRLTHQEVLETLDLELDF